MKAGAPRPTIFKGPRTRRVQGELTTFGGKCHDAVKTKLAKLANWKGSVSDASAIEYAAIVVAKGEDEALKRIKRPK